MPKKIKTEKNSDDKGIVIPGLVSTIIPVYNRAALLQEAVESVIAQTYRPIEIILIDDGSTDDTSERIADLTKKYSEIIRTTKQSNQGPGVARETGRLMAKGEFIQYLDSDDLLLPDKFELQIDSLRTHPEAGIAYGKTHHSGIGDELQPIPFKRTGETFETLFPALLISRWWSTSTPLYRRSVTDAIGSWTDLWNEEDWEYETRAGRLGVKLVHCDDFVSVTRWHASRLHQEGTRDSKKLGSRAKAHALIFEHATAAGITPDRQEMQHFARELFLMARQCGNAGLSGEAKRMFELSRIAAGANRSKKLDFILYRSIASLIGWAAAGKLACMLDRFRKR
jgi:glycosyltransferase involved in cell wall biosynthesis